jgi:hypothetical protein
MLAPLYRATLGHFVKVIAALFARGHRFMLLVNRVEHMKFRERVRAFIRNVSASQISADSVSVACWNRNHFN